VSLLVKNTGERRGAEVVQVYVHDVRASVPRPEQELKAFAKVELGPSEEREVRLELDARTFSYYDPARHDWVLEPGEFELRVGSSSRDIRLKARWYSNHEPCVPQRLPVCERRRRNCRAPTRGATRAG